MDYTYENIDLATDYHIYMIVKGKKKVDPNLMQLAFDIYEERDLGSHMKQALIADFKNLEFEVMRGLQEGSSIEEETEFLMSNGIDRLQAQALNRHNINVS